MDNEEMKEDVQNLRNKEKEYMEAYTNVGFIEDEMSVGNIIGVDPAGNIVTLKIPGNEKEYKEGQDHVFVDGGDEMGKTRCIGMNNVLQAIRRGESYIVADTHEEYYTITSALARDYGYKVKVLDSRTEMHMHSDSFNAIRQMQFGIEEEALPMACILCNYTGPSDDSFYQTRCKCLAACILMVFHMEEGKAEISLSMVWELLNLGDWLKAIFQKLGRRHPAYSLAQAYLSLPKQVQDECLEDLKRLLLPFTHPGVKEITRNDEIEVLDPMREKCAYYVISGNEADKYGETQAMLFFYSLLNGILMECDTREGKMIKPINIIFDDVKYFANIPNFEKFMDGGRKVGIHMTFISNDEIYERVWTKAHLLEILYRCNLLMSFKEDFKAKMFAYANHSMNDQKMDEIVIHIQDKGVKFKVKKYDYTNHYMANQISEERLKDRVSDSWLIHVMNILDAIPYEQEL